MTLEQIEKYLDESAPAFLATLGTCGNPRIRPVQSPLLFNGKIYFCTANTKNLYKHIQKHDGIEFCSVGKDYSFLRLRANAIFESNLEVKKAMFEKYPDVAEIYKDPANPIFEVFYLANLSARLQKTDGSFEEYKA